MAPPPPTATTEQMQQQPQQQQNAATTSRPPPYKKRRVSHLPEENVPPKQQQQEEEEDPFAPLAVSSVVSFCEADLPVLLNDSEIGLVLDNDDEDNKGKDDTATALSLLDLPDDLTAQIASFLNVGSLKGSRLVCRKLCRIFSRDDAGWSNHCQRLWKRKVHVLESAETEWKQSQSRNSNPISTTNNNNDKRALEAYRSSCMDARLRHEIRPAELIYDPSAFGSTVWDFRFKESAGPAWTIYDPWYVGMPARKMVFLPDGRVQQLTFEVVQEEEPGSRAKNGRKRVPRLRNPFFDSTDPNGVSVTWRYVLQPMDLPAKAQGAYIRLTVGGRDVPTYLVHRSPCNNWGFILESCWGVFASFSLPPRNVDHAVSRHQPPLVNNNNIPRNIRFTHLTAQGMPVNLPHANRHVVFPDDEDDDDNDNTNNAILEPRTKRNLLEDSSLCVTNRWQWREALLYNSGANTLPDGPTAAAEFDEAWRAAVTRLQSFGFSLQHISDRLQM